MKKTGRRYARYIAIASLFILVCLIYTARLVSLQLKKPEVTDASKGLSERTLTVQAIRGEIYDRNGKALVSNKYSYNVILEKGGFPKKNADINTLLIDIIKTLPERTEHMFPVEGTYPNYSYFGLEDTNSTVYKRFVAMLDRFELSRDINCHDFIDALLDRYGLLDKENKINVDETYLYDLLALRYDLERSDFSVLYPYTLSTDISNETLTRIKEKNFPGVEINKTAFRVYNYPGYASHILGRTGKIQADDADYYKELGYPVDAIVGIDGAEKAFESYLHGQDGILVIVEDKEGNTVEEYYKKEPVAGNDVYLTLDIDMQIRAEDSLKNNIELIKAKANEKIQQDILKYTGPDGNLYPWANISQHIGEDASAGAATAINPNTGEVYALASNPTFDLSLFNISYGELSADPARPLYNRALQGVYEPGSTFKVGVAATALQTGLITQNDMIYDSGVYTYYAPTYQPACWLYNMYRRGHGNMNVTRALQDSCNYFFYDVGRRLTIQTMNEYSKQFGLGENTGIELPESKGVLAGPAYSASRGKAWVPGDTLQAAIGQSDNTFSPLQLSVYLSTIINGGTRYKAHLLHSVRKYGTGEVLYSYEPEILNTVALSSENVNIIKNALRRVTENGSASSLFSRYPIEMGGKTGTAQVGTGTDKSNNGIFVAFAPYDNPEIVSSCIIEQGSSGTDAGYTVRDIFNYYFNIG